MTLISLQDAYCYVGGYDFTTDTNNATLTTEVAQLDATTFNSNGWTEVAGGLKSTTFAYTGYQSRDLKDGVIDQAPDPQLFPKLGTTEPCTFGPVETENQVAYIFNAMKSQYTQGGQIGDLASFSVSSNRSGSDGVIRGRLAAARQTITPVVNFVAPATLGAGLNLGALSASQYLYCTFHLFETINVPSSITLKLQSDDNSGFTTPTDLATIGTFTDVTGPGGTWLTRVAGPITDTWFRLYVTALTGSVIVAGAIGKQ